MIFLFRLENGLHMVLKGNWGQIDFKLALYCLPTFNKDIPQQQSSLLAELLHQTK